MSDGRPDDDDGKSSAECENPAGSTRRSSWRSWKWTAIRVCVLLFMTMALMAIWQRQLIYRPTNVESITADMVVSPASGWFTDVATETNDGVTLHGWHVRNSFDKSSDEDHFLIVFMHGNAGDRRQRADQCINFAIQKFDVLIFDYRGYGDNKGEPSEAGLRKDAAAMWSYAVNDLEYAPERVIVYGRSLGGGVAVQLAASLCRAETPPGALMLASTFSSLTDTAAAHFPWIPVRLLLWDRYSSVTEIRDVTVPILQFHGTDDKIVPYRLGQRLFEAAPETSSNGIPKTFVSMENVAHNDDFNHWLMGDLKSLVAAIRDREVSGRLSPEI